MSEGGEFGEVFCFAVEENENIRIRQEGKLWGCFVELQQEVGTSESSTEEGLR